MEQIISFPGLGLEFEIDRVAFYLPEFLNSRPIYWYGVLIALGFLLAIIYIVKRANVFGLDSDRTFDVTMTTIISGIIGARLYYIAFSWDQYKDNLADIIRTDKGGLAIYGGIILGALGLMIGAKIRNVRLKPMADLTVGGVILAQAIGRWGNFFNMEAFGGNTTLPWGMTSSSIVRYLESNQAALAKIGMVVDPSQPVHPTFLYESLWCLLGFLAILVVTKKRKFDGQVALFYFGWYGLGRMLIEGLRTDSLMVGGFRVSQLVALICFIGAVVLTIVKLVKLKKSDDPEEYQLYVNTEEAKLILAGEFYPKSKKDKNKTKSAKENYEKVEDKENPGREELLEDDEKLDEAEDIEKQLEEDDKKEEEEE